MRLHCKKNVILVLIGMTLGVSAQTPSVFKAFDTPSAMINYEINGSGKVSVDSNLSIKGKATLLFTEWGARKLYTEKYVRSTTGAVKNVNTIRLFIREDRGDVYTVDFDKKMIETSKDAVLKTAIEAGEYLYQKKMDAILKNGKKVGNASVLGLRCDEWIYEGQKRCYYKGIPLKEESMVSGITVVKTAISAEFDKNISEETYALPEFEYSKQKGFLMNVAKETTDQKSLSDNGADENDSNKTDGEAFVAEKTPIVEDSDLTKNVFDLQKSLLPKLLSEMQEARVCLENANDKNEANLCLSKLLELEEEISGEKNTEGEITIWTKIIQNDTMENLEEEIMDMKRRMPCIRRSRDFDDLSECMHNTQ